MSDIIERLARAICFEQTARGMFMAFDAAADSGAVTGPDKMKAALLWLADNVSDEMSIAAVVDWQNDKSGGTLQEWLQSAISAALRAAGDGR